MLKFFKRDSGSTPPHEVERGGKSEKRASMRVGIPRVLNVWSTHQFWIGFLRELGIKAENIIFSSETSEEQGREFGKGRGTVDCCYPVKCISGHYGELVFSKRKKVDIVLSPMIHDLPSFMQGHVQGTLSCPRVMAGPENIKSGFLKERDIFKENNIEYVTPFVSLGEDPKVVTKQLYDALKDTLALQLSETRLAVTRGFEALNAFNRKMRMQSRAVLSDAVLNSKPVVMVLARPYHMDSGIGHEIEADLQAQGYAILWYQYFPIDDDIMDWLFGDEIAAGEMKSAFDISNIWTSSYSSNTNEIMWGANVAARCPNITCVIRLSSYECGMDQPTYTPTQKTVEASGTLFFKFGDLDSTKPSGGIKIRIETIVHYLRKYSDEIIVKKSARLLRPGPFRTGPYPTGTQQVPLAQLAAIS
jgi:predicted nucleotide-binding protein (sugar kinase/HSP70/actin superfamily)